MNTSETSAEHEGSGADGFSSKQEKLDRLEASAIVLFSSHGFEGTSLRDIAAHADVPLSMIDRYFGSKIELFNEVQRNIWKQINIDRDALLQNPIARTSEGSPTLDAVLHAVIHPVVARAVGNDRQAPMVRLLRENTSMRVHMGLGRGPKHVVQAENWVDAVMAACPQLTPGEAVWALSFVIGTMYCGQLLDGWLDDLMPPTSPASAEYITKLMVDFCSAGVHALSAKRGRTVSA